MKNVWNCCALALLACFIAACASTSKDFTRRDGSEVCRVCQHNNDLACVCVNVTDSTPRVVYQGVTNYFCSEDCRAAFVKKPAKYSAK